MRISLNDKISKEKLYSLFTSNYNKDEFSLFLKFINNINLNKSDFDILFFRMSIGNKIQAINILKKDTILQIEKALEEKKEIKEKGYSSGIESTILLVRFETFVNSVYSLFDNLAYFGHITHRDLPRKGFNQLKNKKIKKCRMEGKLPEYDTFFSIIESCSWYDMLHTIRSESIHYHNGFVCYPEDENNMAILYQNMIHSNEKIKIEDIKKYVIDTIENINKFLRKYGKYYINNFIQEDSKIYDMCLIEDEGGGYRCGLREITLKDYLNKDCGKCKSPDSETFCPFFNFCPAYENR